MTRSDDLPDAFARIVASRADVLSVSGDSAIFPHYAQIAAFATKQKIVSIGGIGYTGQGGLLTFGTNLLAMTERVAAYIDRILRGAKPADLPVEQPSKYELVLNMKTAKAIGLKLSPAFMVQVDRIVE
jgi:putative ABC transport system substrate-binding protein